MPNASSADGRAGFDIFRENPDLTLEQLNRQLTKQGFGKIAERSIRHYRSLLSHGLDRYVSVNRFDVARASRPYEGASATPRYFYYGVTTPITMSFQRGNKDFQVTGVAERIGEVGAILTFEDSDQLEALKKDRPSVNTYVSLDFDTPDGEAATARVIESEVEDEWVLVEVEFTRLQSTSRITASSPLSGQLTTLTIQGTSIDDRAADLIGRRIYYTLEAVENCRAIANEILRTEGAGQDVVNPFELRSLSVESPLVIVLVAPPAITTVLLGSWLFVKSALKAGGKFYETIQSANVDKATAKKIEAEAKKVEAETEGLQLKNAAKRQDIERRALVFGLAREELLEQAKLKQAEVGEADDARRDTLTKNLVESVEALERQDVENVHVTVA